MMGSQTRRQSADPRPPQLVQVWDLPTRLFHWLLVASVSMTMVTGFVAPEWWLDLHIFGGYGVVLLLVFRFAWGIYGTEYARLVSLARATGNFGAYLRGLALLRPPHYVGHNPVGALMIFGFFAVFAGLVLTGLLAQAGEEKQGPLAGITSYALGHTAKEVHEALAITALAMIAIHICGVMVESWLQNVNLVRGMIDGRMPVPPEFSVPTPRPARPVQATIVVLAFVTVSSAALFATSRIPPLGILEMPENTMYRSECGACHWPYHPSLLPHRSWDMLLAKLDDHFGEDASLPDNARAEIARHLEAYSAENWDTEAANRFRTISPSDPTRITKTAYWISKHGQIDTKLFRSTAVKGRGNCMACHADAESGRFDDQAIKLPTASGR